MLWLFAAFILFIVHFGMAASGIGFKRGPFLMVLINFIYLPVIAIIPFWGAIIVGGILFSWLWVVMAV